MTSAFRSFGTSDLSGGDTRLSGGHGDHSHCAHAHSSNGIVQVDLRRFATELQGHPLYGRKYMSPNLPSDGGQTGERHHVDGGIGREQLGSLSPDPRSQTAGKRRLGASGMCCAAKDE